MVDLPPRPSLVEYAFSFHLQLRQNARQMRICQLLVACFLLQMAQFNSITRPVQPLGNYPFIGCIYNTDVIAAMPAFTDADRQIVESRAPVILTGYRNRDILVAAITVKGRAGASLIITNKAVGHFTKLVPDVGGAFCDSADELIHLAAARPGNPFKTRLAAFAKAVFASMCARNPVYAVKDQQYHSGGVVSVKMSDGTRTCWVILAVSNDSGVQPCERVRTARNLTVADGKDGCEEVLVLQLTGVCASGGADVSPLLTVGSAVLQPTLLLAAMVDPAQAASQDVTNKTNEATQSGAALAAASRNVQAAQDRAEKAHQAAEAAARSTCPALGARAQILLGQAASLKDQLVRSAAQLMKCATHATAAAASLQHSANMLEAAAQAPNLRAQDKQRLAEAARVAKLQATQLAASAKDASAHASLLVPEDGSSRQNAIPCD